MQGEASRGSDLSGGTEAPQLTSAFLHACQFGGFRWAPPITPAQDGPALSPSDIPTHMPPKRIVGLSCPLALLALLPAAALGSLLGGDGESILDLPTAGAEAASTAALCGAAAWRVGGRRAGWRGCSWWLALAPCRAR